MPTEKRARQRAARYEKQAELQKARTRRRQIRRGVSLLVLVLAVVLIIVLVGSSSGPKKKAAAGASSSTTSTTTTTVATAAVAPTCPTATEKKRILSFTKAPPDCIPKTSVWQATFTTTLGKFVVEMDAAKSYAAVNNFVFLTRWNYYEDDLFWRVIPGFVIQGGDPTGTGESPDPGYKFTGNYPPESCKTKPTASQCYEPGDFVMANSNSDSSVQNASTDASQYFFVLPGGQTTLDSEPTYTIFGKVTSGMSVVEKIGADGSSSGTPKVKVYVEGIALKELSS